METIELNSSQTQIIIIERKISAGSTTSVGWADMSGLQIALHATDTGGEARAMTISLNVGGVITPPDDRDPVDFGIAIDDNVVRSGRVSQYEKGAILPVHLEHNDKTGKRNIIEAKWKSESSRQAKLLGVHTILKVVIYPPGVTIQ